MTAGSRPSNFVKSRSIMPPILLCACRQNKKPAGAYRASGPMSANFDALLKPPRARSCAVMMVTVMSRGEAHCGKHYTRAAHGRQAHHKGVGVAKIFRPAQQA